MAVAGRSSPAAACDEAGLPIHLRGDRMKHDHPIGLTLAEGARGSCDSTILEALAAAEAEAARFEAMDLLPGRHDTHRGMLKSAAYFEAEHQRCQLQDDLRRRLLRGELVATARERPTGPRGEVAAEAWAHLYPHMNDDTARDGMGVLALYEVRIAPPVPVVAGSLAEVAKAWMIQTVTHRGRFKREGTIVACAEATGCTHREAVAAWTALPPNLKRSRGRPKKSGE